MGKMIPKWQQSLFVAAALMFLALSPGQTQTRNVAPQPLGRLVDGSSCLGTNYNVRGEFVFYGQA
jgi:hypothetical protein